MFLRGFGPHLQCHWQLPNSKDRSHTDFDVGVHCGMHVCTRSGLLEKLPVCGLMSRRQRAERRSAREIDLEKETAKAAEKWNLKPLPENDHRRENVAYSVLPSGHPDTKMVKYGGVSA